MMTPIFVLMKNKGGLGFRLIEPEKIIISIVLRDIGLI